MTPRFANPHLVTQETEVVSRAALNAEHDLPRVEIDGADDNSLTVLERLLKRSLGNVNFSDFGKAASPGPSSGRRQKRRRLNGDDGPHLEVGDSTASGSIVGRQNQFRGCPILICLTRLRQSSGCLDGQLPRYH